MKSNKVFVRTTLLTSGLVALLSAGSASAVSACKGLDDSACNSDQTCRWVEGYERKDGRQVKSFCRTKPTSKKKADQKTDTSSD